MLQKNKKAEGGFLLLLIVIWLLFIIGSWFSSTNPYDSFMEDCEDLNREEFPCSGLTDVFRNCTWQGDKLKEYCQDKWINKNMEVKE